MTPREQRFLYGGPHWFGLIHHQPKPAMSLAIYLGRLVFDLESQLA
jgi:hypothetical protein